jgi:(p)ppGpp synthase/HD superfamily hydrolase
MFWRAIRFAQRAHSGQYRKISKAPFIFHPLGVAWILIRNRYPWDLVVAAVLHDTVEDTFVTIEDIRNKFGDRISRLVESVTAPDIAGNWRQRKQTKLHRLESCSASDHRLILSAADSLYNLRSLRQDQATKGDEIWALLSAPKLRQEWYFRSLDQLFADKLVYKPDRKLAREFHDEVVRVFGSVGIMS